MIYPHLPVTEDKRDNGDDGGFCYLGLTYQVVFKLVAIIEFPLNLKQV